MMVRWMCRVSLKDRKRSVECKCGDDYWVSACRNVVVAGVRCAGRGRKTWRECVKDDMVELGLHPEWAVCRDVWIKRPRIGENV